MFKNMTLAVFRFLIGGLFIVTSVASANDVKIVDDYAYKSLLSESDQALQQIQIPVDVLLSLTRSDLGDIEVFDRSGNIVPSWIRQEAASHTSERVELNFHTFNSYLHTRSKTVTIRKNLSNQNFPDEETTEVLPVQQSRQDFIIELSALQRKLGIYQLELDWTHQPADQILKLKVEVANDLDHWRTVHRAKNLSIKPADHNEWKMIGSIPKGYQYIRLTPLNSIQSFNLKQINGQYDLKHSVNYLWHQAGHLKQNNEDKDYYAFSLPSAIHLEKIKIIPAGAQQLITGALYASQDKFENKRLIKSGIQQHNISNSDQVVASSPISISAGFYKSWWFKADQVLPSEPQLELAYPIYQMLFLGNNNGPYTLAWGNYQAAAPDNDLIGILSSQNRAHQTQGALVKLGVIQDVGGETRLLAEQKIPWLKWLLWLLLVVAIMVTAKMALSLYRDMKPS